MERKLLAFGSHLVIALCTSSLIGHLRLLAAEWGLHTRMAEEGNCRIQEGHSLDCLGEGSKRNWCPGHLLKRMATGRAIANPQEAPCHVPLLHFLREPPHALMHSLGSQPHCLPNKYSVKTKGRP